jgi:hypothetical protein
MRERFGLSPYDLYDTEEEVDYTALFEIAGLPIPELRDRPWSPVQHPSLAEEGTARAPADGPGGQWTIGIWLVQRCVKEAPGPFIFHSFNFNVRLTRM